MLVRGILKYYYVLFPNSWFTLVLEYHNTVVQQYEGRTAAVVRRGEHRSYLTYHTHVTGLTPPGSSWGGYQI